MPWRDRVRRPCTAPSPRIDSNSARMSTIGARRRICLHARLARKTAASAPKIERRARAVRHALLFAEPMIDAARELPADQRVGDDERVIGGRLPRRTEVTDAQFRLRRAGPIDEDNPRVWPASSGRVNGTARSRRRSAMPRNIARSTGMTRPDRMRRRGSSVDGSGANGRLPERAGVIGRRPRQGLRRAERAMAVGWVPYMADTNARSASAPADCRS